MQYRTSIGLDVHARSVAACALDHLTGEVVERTFIEPAPQDIVDWASQFEAPMRAVYETGPTGFVLARSLNEGGLECVVAATSRMLRPSGERVKTDRRDARFLARMLSTNNIPPVHIPDAGQEAAKDLVRQREDAREALTRAKLRMSHFLLRKGHVWGKGRKSWSAAYVRWLSGLRFETELDKAVFDEFHADVTYHADRRDRIQRVIESEAKKEPWARTVDRLVLLKGVSAYTAFAIAVEVGDFERFPSAKAFQAYLGLNVSEHSSGESSSRGGITLTGNALVRKLLVEAAWTYMRQRTFRSDCAAEGVPAQVVEHARKGCLRLRRRAEHLQRRGKKGCVVNVAVARELAGWVWALATM